MSGMGEIDWVNTTFSQTENQSDKFQLESIEVDMRKLFEETNIIDFDTISLANFTLLYEKSYQQQSNVRNMLVIAVYSAIFIISLLGNLMVCHIIVTNRKLHTFTNFFIANLSVSDLLMTMVNVPFGVARMLLHNWPFGDFLCKCLPFIQATSV